MASYRKLAEDAVANQQELRGQLEKLITSADARSAGRRSGP